MIINNLVVGLINNRTIVFRLEIVKEITSAIMKKIINSFLPKGNIIITDGLLCYSWLDNADSGYIHHVHNHWHGNFGEWIRNKKFDGTKCIKTSFEETLKYIDNSGNINLYDLEYL